MQRKFNEEESNDGYCSMKSGGGVKCNHYINLIIKEIKETNTIGSLV